MQPHEAPVAFWLANFIVTPEGNRFSFAGRPWLYDVVEEAVRAPQLVLRKASQVGATVTFLLCIFYLMLLRKLPAGAAYFFPTDGDVRELSKTKAFPLIDKNYIKQHTRGRADEVYLKQIGGAWLFFRGTMSTIRMKAITVDLTAFDEADEIPPAAQEMAAERGHASVVNWIRHFSRPSIPNYGIDRTFQLSDQRFWMITCRGCRHEFELATSFPECIVETPGEVYRACPSCHARVGIEDGRWVARNPGAPSVGFHLSQLMSPFTDLRRLLQNFRETDRPAEFYRGRLGLPYVEAEGKLDVGEVLALATGPRRVLESKDPCFLGVDIGRVHHWIALRREVQKIRVVGFGEVPTFEAVDHLMAAFNVQRCVMDANPEVHAAIAFARRWKDRAWLNYYTGGAHAEPPKWTLDEDRKFWRVSCHRTEQLDRLLALVRAGKGSFELPVRDDAVQEYAEHLAALVRTSETDDDTGDVSYHYVKTGPDHLAHATVYALLAAGEQKSPPKSVVIWGT